MASTFNPFNMLVLGRATSQSSGSAANLTGTVRAHHNRRALKAQLLQGISTAGCCHGNTKRKINKQKSRHTSMQCCHEIPKGSNSKNLAFMKSAKLDLTITIFSTARCDNTVFSFGIKHVKCEILAFGFSLLAKRT